jgi:hypothetical protein
MEICVSVAVFRHILQTILKYITKVCDIYNSILGKLKTKSGRVLEVTEHRVKSQTLNALIPGKLKTGLECPRR